MQYFVLQEIKMNLSGLLAFTLSLCLYFWFTTFYVYASLFTFITIGVIFLSLGFVFDTENHKITNIYTFLGISFGVWKKLPEIEYISVLRVIEQDKSFQASSATFVNKNTGNYEYQINLVLNDKSKKPITLLTTNLNNALNKGIELGKYLNIRVFDSTSPNKHWIE